MAKAVGQTLREERTRKGIELDEVERVTKIRVKFLRAMEEDRWDELPAPVYARGFLSTYADYLGLDDLPLLERAKQAIGEPERPTAVPEGVVRAGQLRRGHPPSRRGVLVVVATVALLTIGVVIAFALGGSSDHGGKGNTRSRSTASKPGRHQATETTPSITATATSPTPPGSEVSLELRATADVWVCVIDDAGTHLVNGETLATGQSQGPFSSTRFEMTFGNGSVEMTVDGQPVKVPALSEPLGFRVSASGAKRLQPVDQPSCA